MNAPEKPSTGLTLEPIGVVRSPFTERAQAPRQPRAAADVEGRVELFAGRDYESALLDLPRWDHIWLLVWLHENSGYRPRVQPPRSAEKRGVFATRAPYRPNPIGLSAVRLLRVEGLTLHVAGLDFLDGTPLLDIKPYVPYTDSIPGANHGWLELDALGLAGGQVHERPSDPLPEYQIAYQPLALQQLAFLAETQGLDLKPRLEATLKLGPAPHAYRRIRRRGEGYRLALKDWRVCFLAEARCITVQELRSGYRARELSPEGQAPAAHRAFVAAWPEAIDH